MGKSVTIRKLVLADFCPDWLFSRITSFPSNSIFAADSKRVAFIVTVLFSIARGRRLSLNQLKPLLVSTIEINFFLTLLLPTNFLTVWLLALMKAPLFNKSSVLLFS